MMNYTLLEELINIHSPSGYTEESIKYLKAYFDGLGFKTKVNTKGALKVLLSDKPVLSIAAHVDTLGAIVSGIKSDGTLTFSSLGGLSLSSAEGEYVDIVKMNGEKLTGTLLLNNPSSHANKERETKSRNYANMHVRIDEEVSTKKEVEDLGIRIGDFICFEPRYREYENGFIKSRFMDNKAGCFVLMELARLVKESGKSFPVELFFSNYEEVGHGASTGYSNTIEELLVIDMGVVGDDCEGLETKCSICAKDSTGPYDFEMRKKLTELAEANDIAHQLDVYPYYGSDGSAALRAGNQFKVGLIGPGVAASHGVERTHKKGIEATIDLCMAYMNDKF